MKYSHHRLTLWILSVRVEPQNSNVGGAFETFDVRGLRHNLIRSEAARCEWTGEKRELRSAIFVTL